MLDREERGADDGAEGDRTNELNEHGGNKAEVLLWRRSCRSEKQKPEKKQNDEGD
jgi:hypothetical protein